MVIRLSRYTNEIMAQENSDTFHTIFIPFRLFTYQDPILNSAHFVTFDVIGPGILTRPVSQFFN